MSSTDIAIIGTSHRHTRLAFLCGGDIPLPIEASTTKSPILEIQEQIDPIPGEVGLGLGLGLGE